MLAINHYLEIQQQFAPPNPYRLVKPYGFDDVSHDNRFIQSGDSFRCLSQ